MLYRVCPECKNKTLRVPLVAESFICRECVSIFTLSFRQKVLYKIVMAIAVVGLSYGALHFVAEGELSIVNYAFLSYIALPIIGYLACKIYCMYFGKLTLSGIKGRLRANT